MHRRKLIPKRSLKRKSPPKGIMVKEVEIDIDLETVIGKMIVQFLLKEIVKLPW